MVRARLALRIKHGFTIGLEPAFFVDKLIMGLPVFFNSVKKVNE